MTEVFPQNVRPTRWSRWGMMWLASALLCVCVPAAAVAEDPVDLPAETATLYLPVAEDTSADAEVEPAATEDEAALPGLATFDALSMDAGAIGEAGEDGAAAPAGEAAQAPSGDGPCLPLHTVEGTGGGLIVPMAYLVNPGPPGTKVGLPSASFTFVKIGKTKNVQQFTVTETFFRRIELGYAMAVLNLGNFPRDVGVDIGDHVTMHNFNLRGLLIEETPNSPAVTAGVTFKYTEGIQRINHRLGGLLTRMGVERANGTDFTLHATKMLPKAAFGKPLILNSGIRFSQAAQLGLLGFGEAYKLTGEGSVVAFVTDWMAVGYEFRQKKDSIGTAGDLVRGEDNWHTIILAFLINEHLGFSCGWGHFGGVANEVEDGVWGFEFKYEF
ncbi:MAG: DUF3034 family protein [Planctomycetes bacterium]|nr:DUF3034 family protein [Planctomycetota bacterium]